MRGEILFAHQGGLVIGRAGSADDIPMVVYRALGVFQYFAHMQGGEYLVSAKATARHRDRLEAINSEKGESTPIAAMAVTDKTAVLNTNLIHGGATLLTSSDGQFVINRFATAKHLRELEQLNAET